MARHARIVAPNMPHHVTQRGNRRQNVFFCDEDYELYLDLMAEWRARYRVEIWAYCLMTNHIHLIAVPNAVEALANAIGEAHKRYTKEINRRERWTGFLWQGRFSSFVMDEPYALQAARHVEMNPVAARMVKHPAAYPWSSATAHLSGNDDRLAKVQPFLDMVNDWQSHLDGSDDNVVFDTLLDYHSSTGWPLGKEAFLDKLAANDPRPVRPARKAKVAGGKKLIGLCPHFLLILIHKFFLCSNFVVEVQTTASIILN